MLSCPGPIFDSEDVVRPRDSPRRFFGPFLIPLSFLTLLALLPLGLPLGLDPRTTSRAFGTSGLQEFLSSSGNISDSQPTNSPPLPFASALSGNTPSSGGGAPGIPPK